MTMRPKDTDLKAIADKEKALRAQQSAHDKGEACDEEDCQDCCGEFIGHEFDPDEGGYCINCGADPH